MATAKDYESPYQLQNKGDGKSFTARPYQVQLFEQAKKKNIIIFLGTGTGKTFIAVLLIKELSHEIASKTYNEGAKRTIFLANTVPLVRQQGKYIGDLTCLDVGTYVGEMGVDFWDKDKWLIELKKHQVLVMSAQIFVNLLQHGYVSLNRVNLLIMDECHHAAAKSNHPMTEVMRLVNEHRGRTGEAPRVLGLSASVINKKVKLCSLEKNVRSLEASMMATIETADQEEAEKYGTKAQERLLIYRPPRHHESVKNIQSPAERALDTLREMIRDKKANSLLGATSTPPEKIAKQSIEWFLSLLIDLGSWCALRAIDIEMEELENLDTDGDKISIRAVMFTVEFYKLARGILEEPMDNYSAREKLENFATPKLRRLVDCLKEFSGDLCGIVFVKQRVAAQLIYEYLMALKAVDPEMRSVEPEWIVGVSGNPLLTALDETSERLRVKSKRNIKILRRFRKHELNLLIATSILEEGLDVPKCNVVIRFDPPVDFRAYVQSRGRARAEAAHFITFEMDDPASLKLFHDTMHWYYETEKSLRKMCIARKPLTAQEIDQVFSDQIMTPYIPFKDRADSPVITINNAVALVNRYCSTLPHDAFFHPSPVWMYVKNGKPLVESWAEDTEEYFDEAIGMDLDHEEDVYCILKFPACSTYKCTIIGPPMPSKTLAKKGCALLAVEMLHKEGELDEEHLLPVKRNDSSDEEEEEEEEKGKPKIGTKGRKRYHGKTVPEEFKGCGPQVNKKAILYEIVTKLEEPIADHLNTRNYNIFHPENEQEGLGILTTKDIPQLEPFRLFTRWGTISVEVREVARYEAIEKEFLLLCNFFHCYAFGHLLDFDERQVYRMRTLDSLLIVPMKKSSEGSHLDIDFVKYLVKNRLMNPMEPLTDEEQRSFRFEEKNFLNKVLCTPYILNETTEASLLTSKYTVEEVDRSKTPLSPFPGSVYKNYKEYFQQRYKVKVMDDHQPLLRCEVFNHRLNMLVPRFGDEAAYESGVSKKKTMAPSSSRGSPYLIPELCRSHQIPASLFRQILWAPSILKRLSVLLSANAIRKRIAEDTGVGSVRVPPAKRLKKLHFSENVDLSRDSGPPVSMILQALTPSKTAEEFDLERLEMIGDSFLKMSVSISLFMQDNEVHEGKLTSRRSRLIRNKKLYEVAEDKGISEAINGPLFIVEKNYLPPNYEVNQTLEEALRTCGVPENHWNITPIKDKVKEMTKEQFVQHFRNQHQLLKKEEEETVDSKNRKVEKREFIQLREWRLLTDKSIADSVEALIGAYLLACGPEATLRVLCWLGIPVLDGEAPNYRPFSPPAHAYVRQPTPQQLETVIPNSMTGLKNLEKQIKYQFKERSFLYQAVCHGSYHKNKWTSSYERLEFLGDAILDYLITWHIYHLDKKLSPGDLTDLRSALVNNTTFGALAVKHGLHKHLRHFAPKLDQVIQRFHDIQEDNDFEIEDVWCVVTETDSKDLEEVEVPKVLGDLFESLAGAIYLDSMDIAEVWRVYQPMMTPLIEKFKNKIPINPVRQIQERSNNVSFGNPIALKKGGRVKIVLTVGKKTYTGIGSNQKQAKIAASKAAIMDKK